MSSIMNRPSTLTASALVSALSFVLLFSSEAAATPTYPDVIRTTLSTPNTPDCTLCHIGTPSAGSVNTPFGKTMRSRGLVANNEASLKTALQALAAEKKDSNGDGVSDIDALKAGQDPNGAAAGADGGASTTPEAIEYGCARVAPKATQDGEGVVLTLGLVGLFVLRLRRRRG